jgi:pyruvate dehydrogenase E1 component
MAGREKLDNLIFVVNCNLQRLDGPVRGNGKIIQELEAEFPRRRLERHQADLGHALGCAAGPDKNGMLKKRMMEVVDGEYQTFKAKDGAYVREHFFNTPELRGDGADWTDEDIWNLNRGGHDRTRSIRRLQSGHRITPASRR